MLHIVSVKWGTKYSSEYVDKLYRGLKRHSSTPFLFHCFTDDPRDIAEPDVITHPLPFSQLTGWWNKLYLFSDDIGLPKGDTMLYFDLDTLIVGNVDPIMQYSPQKLVTLRDFYQVKKHGPKAAEVGSGILMWKKGDCQSIWLRFMENPQKIMRLFKVSGDQKFIEGVVSSRMYWQDLFPGKVVSFKVHCQQGLPEQASIICYHGKPNIPESAHTSFNDGMCKSTPQPWILEHWI